MHFFSRKNLAISALMMLMLCAMVLFNSGTGHAYAATHAPSVASQATTHNIVRPAAGTVHGCPVGYACIYPQNAGWNGDHPSNTYYNYGTYKLYNQYGNHYIYNNQTGGAPFWLCTDSYGKTCPWYVAAGTSAQTDFTPLNSVKLVPSL
ncbi:hypothetical protein KDW_60110 [Dictyobacter vulcani]|uniref:Peptidase inhibitor family I36 n=1 Tax=Dictyobacter vulcani TaxID=2607529 RepID=A0A5J4L0N1_9CHLR|nr:hypothetical protein [Dictyobacter vulcani]GER91849.1 hypothetical protein KDW_60110 [Dictyobacter vulcani]